MVKKNIISASDSTALKLAVLAKEKEIVRRKLAVTAEKLAVVAKEKENVRHKLLVTAKNLDIKAKQLAVTAKEKEDARSKLAVTAKEKESVRGKLALTAETLRLRAKQLAVLAKEKESIRSKLATVAKQLAITAKEKESVRLKLVVTAKEKESVRSKLAVVAKQLATTAKEKENIRSKLAVTAKKLKGFYKTLEEKIIERTKDLAEAKAKDEALLQSIGEGVIGVDLSGKIIFANQAAQTMLGRRSEDITGRILHDVLMVSDEKGNFIPREKCPVCAAFKMGSVNSFSNYSFVRSDKTKFPVAINVQSIIIEGKLAGAVDVFRDITKEKEIDTAKTEFISTVSHELRTPLAITIEGIGLVIDEIIGKINKKQKETLLVAKNNLYRLSSIINDMLDIAKIEAGKMEINKELVDMGELIKKVVASLRTKADKKGLKLRIVLPEKRVNIYADPDKITQVLINLINNSIKFTNAGHIEVGVKEFANEIQCYISDTGIGIANKYLPLAFNKFQQFDRQPGSGEKGTGLGLAICKAIVVSHQGKIWVESEKGKWTKVIFTLPKRSNKKN